ncbi:MAG: hypothetical protein GY866_12465, partial [Proteobacteria bacterium]|nr:hypothetical protein [Pseudomonadota bacterium]
MQNHIESVNIPPVLFFPVLEKGFVHEFTRADGTTVSSHFTKRPPAKVKEKHLRERFHDHDGKSAKKAHAELEALKDKHALMQEAARRHLADLKKEGDKGERNGISHADRVVHLETEIENRQTHIDNHTRKQKHIKNRISISEKQSTKKRGKATLERNLKRSSHTDEQKKTIRDIHDAHHSGKSPLKPGRIMQGKDRDHIYLETHHKDTGAKHHVAIHKDGKVHDPQVAHGGKFDSKTLKEFEKPKTVVVKKTPAKPVEKKGNAPIEIEGKLNQGLKDHLT